MLAPALVVQKQLDAFNAKDLDTWLSTYAANARQFEFPNTLLASGLQEIRQRAEARFQEECLHATLLSRAVMGDTVIDYEVVKRQFPEGLGSIALTCIYQVVSEQIQTASFIFGKKTLL